MPGKTARASVCAAVALLGIVGIVVAGCGGKDYRQIVVVEGDKAEFFTFGPPPKEPQPVYTPGRIIAFRTDSPVPGIPNAAGKAGHIYRVNDQRELEEIDSFQLTMPNDTLAYRYGK